MLEDVLAPDADVDAVLVYHTSRFMRNAARARALKDSLAKHGERKRKKRHFTRAHRPAGVIPSAPFEPDALRRPGFAPVRGRAALLGSCFRVTGQTPAPAASTRRPQRKLCPPPARYAADSSSPAARRSTRLFQ